MRKKIKFHIGFTKHLWAKVSNRVKQKFEFKMYVKRMDEENIFVDNKNAFQDCQSSALLKQMQKLKIFFANSKDLAEKSQII